MFGAGLVDEREHADMRAACQRRNPAKIRFHDAVIWCRSLGRSLSSVVLGMGGSSSSCGVASPPDRDGGRGREEEEKEKLVDGGEGEGRSEADGYREGPRDHLSGRVSGVVDGHAVVTSWKKPSDEVGPLWPGAVPACSQQASSVERRASSGQRQSNNLNLNPPALPSCPPALLPSCSLPPPGPSSPGGFAVTAAGEPANHKPPPV